MILKRINGVDYIIEYKFIYLNQTQRQEWLSFNKSYLDLNLKLNQPRFYSYYFNKLKEKGFSNFDFKDSLKFLDSEYTLCIQFFR